MTEYTQPTPAEVQAYIAEARRLRAETLANFIRSILPHPTGAVARAA